MTQTFSGTAHRGERCVGTFKSILSQRDDDARKPVATTGPVVNEGIERIKGLTDGVGAASDPSARLNRRRRCAASRSRDGADLFYRHVHLRGSPAPVRRYLPRLIELRFKGTISPGKVVDLTLPRDRARIVPRPRGLDGSKVLT